MAVTVRYDADQRLVIEGLACDCGLPHNTPTQDIYVGKGLIDRTPELIRKRGLGTHCVLIADGTTYEVAGRAVQAALTADGFDVKACVMQRDGDLLPNELACGEVLLTIDGDTDFLISVGSGSITDTARVNSMRTGLPFVCVATAPSMDGYTSVVSPLLLRNVKIHRAGVCPDIIVCDLDVLATAPPKMVASGVGDVLGKYIAIADWKIGHVINGEPYCPACGQIVLDAVAKLMDHAEAIRDRTEAGMRILIEGLLLSGVTVLLIGNTRAVASIEHNIAQFWEMKQLQRGMEPPMHGSSVGVATRLVWPMFTRFAREDLSGLSLSDIKERRPSREARERWMIHAYGEEGGRSIMRENPGDFLSWKAQQRRIHTAQQRFDELKSILGELPPLSRIEETMRTLRAPMTPAEEGIDPELLGLSLRCGKDYRTRYTLFKLLDECGLLEEYVKEYPYAGA